jgi:hypothetical protein
VLPEAAALAAVAWLAAALPFRMLTPERYAGLRERERATRIDSAFIRAHPGPAFCERMLLCYLAGKPLVLQPYFTPEMVATHELPEDLPRRLFDERIFDTVQLDRPIALDHGSPDPRAQRLAPGLVAAVARHYHLAHVSPNGALYVANGRAEASSDRAFRAAPFRSVPGQSGRQDDPHAP